MSKIKLLVEIDEDEYKIRKEMAKDGFDSAVTQMIVNGTPYNPSGDCISREALKKEICVNTPISVDETWEQLYDSVVKAIDNAPRVFDCRSCKNNGNERYCLDCHDYCNFARYEARPQGEWKTVGGYDGDEYYKCSNCGELWFLSAGTPKDNNMNFCPNCGAQMGVGAE